MRWSWFIALLGLFFTPAASTAQRPPDDQRPDRNRSISPSDSFFTTTALVRFELIQGRLELDSLRHRKGAQQRHEQDEYESITVTAERGIPSLHYVYQSPQQQLTVNVRHARHVRIESWLVDDDERAVLVQPERGSVSCSIQRGDLRDQATGNTLLHLQRVLGTDFDRHFEPLIHHILRGTSIPQLSQQADQILIDQSQPFEGPCLQMICDEVDKLRAPRQSTRRSAERQLLSWGTTILPVLHTISVADLDAEQRARLAAITLRLRPRVEDTPASLAKLLANDRSYWAIMLPRLRDGQTPLVAAHLHRLGLHPTDLQQAPVARIATANE
jgi:hypothetical protein